MNDEILEKVRRAGVISGEARELGANMVDEGVKLLDVANEVEAYIIRKGAKPAFPTNLSINEVAAHYSPHSEDKLTFKRGDLVKVDVGAQVDGYIGDTAKTVEVRTKNWTNLIAASAKALTMATVMVGEGVQVGSIGGAIDRAIRSDGFVPVSNLTGHGLNHYNLHGTQLWHQVISVDPNAIEYVYRSNSRLPPELVSKTFALYSQKRNFRLFIAKDESPMEVLIGPEHSGLGLFDFPHLPEGYEPNDIVNVVGYDRWSKKNLAGQLKEDKKNKNVPLRILDVVNQDNWRPEKKVYHAHPWEVHYCIYPSIDGVQSTAYADKRYGGNILKRNEMNEEKYHNLQVPINEEKNRARAAILANTQLVQPNQRVQNDDGRFPLPPAIEPEYLDDDIFKNMG